jgi:hypothetical protein
MIANYLHMGDKQPNCPCGAKALLTVAHPIQAAFCTTCFNLADCLATDSLLKRWHDEGADILAELRVLDSLKRLGG